MKNNNNESYNGYGLTRIFIGESEDERVDISSIAGASIAAQRKTSFWLAEVDHVERQREIGVVIDRVATQQLRRSHGGVRLVARTWRWRQRRAFAARRSSATAAFAFALLGPSHGPSRSHNRQIVD